MQCRASRVSHCIERAFLFIKMKELSDFEISEFGKPSMPGIYAVWACNYPFENGMKHLLYIGSCINLYTRLNNNSHPYRKAFNRLNGIVWVSFIETENLRENEKYLINNHNPILNRQWR